MGNEGKNASFIGDEINRLFRLAGMDGDVLDEYMSRLRLELDYHFGGYGKYTEELIQFINTCYQEIQIPFDQIYPGKMFYALMDLVKKDTFKKGDRIVALHTGGLQGLDSISEKLDFKI